MSLFFIGLLVGIVATFFLKERVVNKINKWIADIGAP